MKEKLRHDTGMQGLLAATPRLGRAEEQRPGNGSTQPLRTLSAPCATPAPLGVCECRAPGTGRHGPKNLHVLVARQHQHTFRAWAGEAGTWAQTHRCAAGLSEMLTFW